MAASSKSPPMSMDHQQRYMWWLRVSILTCLLLSGQVVSTLLVRLYFTKGGNSKWFSTLVQIGSFPVLLPILFFFPKPNHTPQNPSMPILVSLYLFLGVLCAANYTMYSFGVANLPVSTFSLICSSGLGFTAFFSYFLNAQKFTPLIINSLVLLTISSILLVFQKNDDTEGSSSTNSKNKYAIGFVCTVVGTVTAGLLLSVMQFAFRKILKSTTLRTVFEVLIYQSLVATTFILIGLFASGQWKTLEGEMNGYELGKALYVITLVGIAMGVQVCSIGLTGLIFEVSSLFSNVIGAFSLLIVVFFSVVFFHDKMSGVKVISMLLALWGSASFIYQEYLDVSKAKNLTHDIVSEVSLTGGA